MATEKFITLQSFCVNYDIEFSFINSLSEFGLVEIITIDKIEYLHQNKINEIETMMRLHHELGVNFEGIDVISNLTEKLRILHKEIDFLKNRIQFYEE
jgi:phage terminase small subunit